MSTHTKRGIHFPALYHAAPLSPIPRTYCKGALADPNWWASMEEEHTVFCCKIRHGFSFLVLHAPILSLVHGFFWHKFKADGSLEWFKARWVLRGSQQLGIDFTGTFSSVVKPATIHTVLSLALSCNWPIHQLDVKNTFLHGTMLSPLGLKIQSIQTMCATSTSIYMAKNKFPMRGIFGLQPTYYICDSWKPSLTPLY